MKHLKKQLALLTALTALIMTGCAGNGNSGIDDLGSSIDAVTETSSTDSGVPTEPVNVTSGDGSTFSAELTKADLNTEWDDSAVALRFDGDTVTPSSTDGLTVENGTVTITKGGTYVLSGTLDDGRVVADLADKTEKVHFIFNGVTLRSKTSAPLTILKADKAVITLADGTENTLSDAAEYADLDENSDGSQFPTACLAAKCDLTVNGGGKLTVEGNANNGIHCKDDFKVVSGGLTVTAANHGIRGNDSVLIHSGSIAVTAGGDGIKTSTADTDGKGVIYIEGGAVTVTAAQDGMDAATDLMVNGGSIAVESGGGTANAAQHSEGFGGFGNFGGGFGGRNNGGRGNRGGFTTDADSGATLTATANTTETDTSVSTKGLKAAGRLTVASGSVAVNSADDALHSDDTLAIGGDAVLTLAAGDDGLHADNLLSIADDASVTVSQSYEGIEAYHIIIGGGNTHIKASDDGINAAGTTEDSADSDSGFSFKGGFNPGSTGILELTGGYLYVNADGDGLDSNGDITMTGGTVVVCGPTNDGNGPLDCGDSNNKITVTGGTLMAVGSTGMMDVPEANYIATKEANAAAGTLIVVTDESGSVLGALKTPKQAAGVIFSANGMAEGYSIYTGGEYDGSFNDDDFAYGGSYTPGSLVGSGSGGGSSFGGGGFGGGRGGRGEQGGGFTPPSGSDSMPEPPAGFDGSMPDPPAGFDGSMPDFPGGGMPGDFGGQMPFGIPGDGDMTPSDS